MRALAVIPGVPVSARLCEVSEPLAEDGALLCAMLSVGICGTDREILQGRFGTAPAGCDYLILGHESLGLVLEAPPQSGFHTGDFVVAVVRHPDPVPCSSCAVGEWDMCKNGFYTEHGIKGRHGFAAERYRLNPRFAIPIDKELAEVGVLVEPASIVAKAWEQALRIGSRVHFAPQRVLITGAGTVGLLAALFAAQHGLDVHVLDRMNQGPKPELVHTLGATYYADSEALRSFRNSFDLILECTGAPELFAKAMKWIGPNGVLALVGVSAKARMLPLHVGQLEQDLVLENHAIFGSVNANLRHYEQAVVALLRAEHEIPGWLPRLLTRRVPLVHFAQAFAPGPWDVKTVLLGTATSARPGSPEGGQR